MKKVALLLSLALIAVGCLTACGGKKVEENKPETASIGSSEIVPGPVLGGWELNVDDTKAFLPEGFEEVFNKAMEGYAGMSFKPVAYLGSQVVSGLNHMVLCQGTAVVPDAQPELKVVVIYQDLEDNAEIKNVTDFDLGKIAAQESTGTEAGLAGGWNVTDTFGVANMPADAQKAFDSALEGLTGVDYQPMALLGRQVVSGTNYAILCHGSTVTAEPVNNIYVVFVYEDLEGKASVNNIVCLNLTDFS